MEAATVIVAASGRVTLTEQGGSPGPLERIKFSSRHVVNAWFVMKRVFWHVLDIIWVALFTIVYLMGEGL
jgi:hypothetical protein